MDRDKAGAKCHLDMDAGHLNRHKCCELAPNGKGITASQAQSQCVRGFNLVEKV